MVAVAPGLALRARLDAAAATLAAAGIATARVDAEWLLAGVLDVGRFDAGLAADRALPADLAVRFEAAVQRRARREPLQRILGWEAFRGLRLRLTDDVLVPRPETEMLAEWALDLLPPPRAGVRPLAVDLGTGSGCVACALAGARVRVVVADLLEGVGAVGADLVTSNPPYLPSALVPGLEPEVSLHEPRAALDGGPDGLALIRRIVTTAQGALGPAGMLVLETGGGAQAASVADLLRAAGYRDVATRADLAGVDRFVAGKR